MAEIIRGKMDVPIESITERTNLKEDLGADSLDLAGLAMDFEDEFDVEIPEDAVNTVATFGEAVTKIMELLEQKEKKVR